jgi:hypothetical protein
MSVCFVGGGGGGVGGALDDRIFNCLKYEINMNNTLIFNFYRTENIASPL